MLQRLEALPGVRGASLVSAIPFGGTRGATGVEIEGRLRQPGDGLIVDQRYISPGYFQTMGIPIVRGRGFTTADDDRAEPVVVINRTMAERYWPNENPIDRRVRVTAGYDAGQLVPHRRHRRQRAAHCVEPRTRDGDVPAVRSNRNRYLQRRGQDGW